MNHEIIYRIARVKYRNYGMGATDIMIDDNGEASLNFNADPAVWRYCVEETKLAIGLKKLN